MPVNKNYSTDLVVYIRVLEEQSYKCIIYNILYIINIYVQYNTNYV